MSISGFVPNPENAATVVAWVQALVDKDEESTFVCLETGFDGRTMQAVREVLGKMVMEFQLWYPSMPRCPSPTF